MAGLSFDHGSGPAAADNQAFKKQLNKVYGWYTGGFIAFIIILGVLEQMGLPRNWIGFIFLFATVALYAGIGIMSRTTDAAEYYVAGRRVPAFYNGMATGADWMSAASFIGMAGTLYLTGYGGPGLHPGLDGWLLPGGAAAGALPAQVRAVHDPRLPGGPLRGQPAALHRHHRRDPVLLHLRGGADLRRGADHLAAVGAGLRGRHLRRPRRHPGVLLPRRHARRHVDAGGAVHHPHHRLPGARGLAVGEADRSAGAAGGVRVSAREGLPSAATSSATTRRSSRWRVSSRRGLPSSTPRSRTCRARSTTKRPPRRRRSRT